MPKKKTLLEQKAEVKAKMADLAQQPYDIETVAKVEDMGNGIQRTTFYAKKDNE